MCGIIGAVLVSGQVAPLIRQSLKRLEYRGYDSSGIATVKEGRIHIKKDKGKIDDIHRRLNFDALPGLIGIGHTRWATHGPPSKSNAHPHIDCFNHIAVVHNGIIENYQELRESLVDQGHRFLSETDTEVIPHLIEVALQKTKRLDKAVAKILPKIEGSYAIAVIDTSGKTLVCARKESPLLLGLSESGYYCASDVPAFLPMTRQTIVLEDDEIACLTANGAALYRLTPKGVLAQLPLRTPTTVQWALDMAEKGGYPHFMLKEIHEQPRALRDTLRIRKDDLCKFAGVLNNHQIICAIAAGTSYHAALASKYMFSQIAGRFMHSVVASEGPEIIDNSLGGDAVVIAVTQSGETIDTIHAIKNLKRQGCTILAITNTVDSSITRLADGVLYTQAGPEIGVAATKTFVTQLACLASLSIHLGELTGKLQPKEASQLFDELYRFPNLLQSIIRNQEGLVKETAQHYVAKPSFFFLGRGISRATAMEGALKIKELAYVHAEGYPAGESKHGPIALVEEGFPIVFVAPNDRTRRFILGNVMEMKSRLAQIITICSSGDNHLAELSDRVIMMPPALSNVFSPIGYVVPLQFLAYYAAVQRGYSPDQPRNLAKAVTVL
ncbi:MAG: glutamine--fructose-6-phosphate transaminase (isomerizing) [Promethearchaeota archaeon]